MKLLRYLYITAFFLPLAVLAQIVCPSNLIYMDGGGGFIRVYDPSQPLSANNPSATTIPNSGGGLTLMGNINGGSVCPTFYSITGGNYSYWNGAQWVNTGHSTGNNAAVNLGGCGSKVYNLVGGTGQVYVYDGTSNGTLLTTIQGFSSGGPFDIVTDCDCNFYILRTSTTTIGQSLTKYNPQGVATQSWALGNMPSTTAGGGFGIVNNVVYVSNTGGLWMGNIGASAVNFTNIPNFNNPPGDFASCPVCTITPGPLNANVTNALLTCQNPTANLIVTSTTSPVSYLWAGPGILGSVTGSAVTVNTPGVYTVIVSGGSCPASTATLYANVFTNTNVVTAAMTPSGNICVSAIKPATLSVVHSSTNEIISWHGPGLVNPPNSNTLVVLGPGSYTVKATNPANGCFATDVVNIVQTPSVTVSVSSSSICMDGFNGSPSGATITASGASGYTLYSSPEFSVANPNFTSMPVVAINPGIATATLVGSNAFCTDTATTSFLIFPNPTITAVPGIICPGETHTFSASGASSYTWVIPPTTPTVSTTIKVSPTVTSVYTVTGSQGDCKSQSHVVQLTVLPTPTLAVVPPTSTICLGDSTSIYVQGSATSFTWMPSASVSNPNAASVTAFPVSSQGYQVVGALNGCTNVATATVVVTNPPVLSMNLSRSAICYTNYFGSPTTISVTPSGATSYTLLSGPDYQVQNPSGSQMLVTAAGPPPSGTQVATATLVGVSGVCTVVHTRTFQITPNPVIMISPQNASLCPGEKVVLTAVGATTYTWLPAVTLQSLSVPQSVVVSPSVTSSYAVRGTSLGCVGDLKSAVTVVLPVPTVTLQPAFSTVCVGSAIQLNALGSGGSYSWQPVTDLSSPFGNTVMASPGKTQTFTVTVSMNSCTNEAMATVSVIPFPTLQVTGTQTLICSGDVTTLKASGAESYSWSPGGSLNTHLGTAVMARPSTSTDYTVRGFNGICTGTQSIFVKTVPRPNMSLSATEGVNTICFGAALTMSVTGAQQYHWYPPEWVAPLGSYSFVRLNPQVNTNFTVVGTNSEDTVACHQLLSYSVMVVPKINAVLTGDESLCLGEKTTLSAQGGNMFNWSPPEGLNALEGSRVVASPTTTTIYSVDVSYGGYCTVQSTLQVEVFPRPMVWAGRDTSYNISDQIILTGTGTGSLSWISGDGISCADCAHTQVYPGRSDCYVLEAINEFGCVAQDIVCLEIREEFQVYIPNSFTPDGDGINDVFLVYGENIYNVRMEIFDRWGQLVFQSADVTVGWDGKYRGADSKSDTYSYRVRYLGLDRKAYERTGHVNLLR